MRIDQVQTYAFLALAVGGVIVGCAAGDDEPSNPAPPSPSATATTATERPPEPATCTNVTRSGPPVRYRVESISAPDALGGAINPGNYELIEVVQYDPNRAVERNEDDPNQPETVPGDTRFAQKNIVLAKDHVRLATGEGTLADNGFANETISASWYKIDGTTLNLSGICPTRTNLAIPYTATETGFILFVQPDMAEFYLRR